MTEVIKKNIPTELMRDGCHLGDGLIFFGNANEDYDALEMFQTGAMRSNMSIKSIKEVAEHESGSPRVTLDIEPTRVGFTIDVGFKEIRNPDQVIRAMGYGTKTTIPSGSTLVTKQQVQLFSNIFIRLPHWFITDTPVVKSTDISPVTYSVNTDYIIEPVNGLIKRVPTGNIDDREIVTVTYTYDKPTETMVSFGSEPTLNYHSLMFVVPHKDGSYTTWVFPKVKSMTAPVFDYNSENFSVLEVEYKALYDTSQLPSEALGYYFSGVVA